MHHQPGKFYAKLYSNGETAHFGPFDTAIQAALAYDQAAIKAGRKKSTLNFPDGLRTTSHTILTVPEYYQTKNAEL